MLHNIIGVSQQSEEIGLYHKKLCDAIRQDILDAEENGGLRFISDLASSSKFTQESGINNIANYVIIKSTSHYNQLMKNIVEKAILTNTKNILIIICNKEFNSRHKLFDTSSTSINHVKETISKLKTIIQTDFFPKNITVLEITRVTHEREHISTGYDKRTFINQI